MYLQEVQEKPTRCKIQRGADAASDHHLLVANIKLKLKKHNNRRQTTKRYDVKKLKNKDKKAEFQVELRNRFTILHNMEQDQLTTEDHWKRIKHILTTACDASIGSRNRKHQEWISSETLIKID